MEEDLEEQNKLLRTLVNLLMNQNLDEESEKAQLLHDQGFNHGEIADIMGKGRSTITGYLSD